jgi:hypothetical protein
MLPAYSNLLHTIGLAFPLALTVGKDLKLARFTRS